MSEWRIDNLETVGGHPITTLGAPKVIDAPGGRAVAFGGEGDALLLNTHPLVGLDRFTVEVLFRPDADGPVEQRFLHLQEDGSEDRLLFETRLPTPGQWFLDTFIKSGAHSHALFARTFLHPVGEWYHAALVFDGREMRHYLNGVQELAHEIAFTPLRAGKTSIGVRMNRVSWFKGAIRMIRFTDGVLEPEAFLKM